MIGLKVLLSEKSIVFFELPKGLFKVVSFAVHVALDEVPHVLLNGDLFLRGLTRRLLLRVLHILELVKVAGFEGISLLGS